MSSKEVLRRIHFPFTAIVGMDDAKLALLVNVVDPLIGGVVLVGDKGTGKSTLVRALAQLLPEIPVAKGCPFNCDPFNPMLMCDYHYDMWSRGEKIDYEMRKMRVVDLPLNATPDRVAGSIDVEKTLQTGKVVFRPGLLAEANRNILYIDEVNLLEDYIADIILDAAASGWNVVEREGISFKHPARFILVGSMNPEEGMLRPQLLDRFGLYVPVEASMDPDLRTEIVRRVEDFHRDPISFYRKWESEENRLRERIVRAREIISKVEIDPDLLKLVTSIVVKLGIKTHRAEITTVRTAKAIAALDGRTRVSIDDVLKAMKLTLPHRLKAKPFETPRSIDEILKEIQPQSINAKDSGGDEKRNVGDTANSSTGNLTNGGRGEPPATGLKMGSNNKLGNFGRIEPPTYSNFVFPQNREKYNENHDNVFRGARRVADIEIASGKGVAIDAIPPTKNLLNDVDIASSLRVSAMMFKSISPPIRFDCIRVRVRRSKKPSLHIILLDTSGSMYVGKRIDIAKKILAELMSKAYVERVYTSLIVFRGFDADVVAWPTKNIEKIYTSLSTIPVGGSTPLAKALYRALNVANMFKKKYRASTLNVYVISDGKANVFYKNPRDELSQLAKMFLDINVKVYSYIIRYNSNALELYENPLEFFTKQVNGYIIYQ